MRLERSRLASFESAFALATLISPLHRTSFAFVSKVLTYPVPSLLRSPMPDTDKINNLTPLARPDPDDPDAMSIHASHAPSINTNFVRGLVPSPLRGIAEPKIAEIPPKLA